ncbi:uncharacterized protein TNCV_4166521 [Trichonephila clavipes]|nr:uncharacterized protein TNCV_4166521 [Trichonephila clavipes]
MFDSSSFANPTPLAHADTSRDVLPRGGTSQWRPTRFNLYDLEMRNARGFNVWQEVYFSGLENVTEFLEGIDNQIKLLEIPSDLSCAYLKGHLMGRALDWYQIFGTTNSNNVERRGWNERRVLNVGNNRGNWRNSEVVHRPNKDRNDYRGSHQNNRQGNQWFERRSRFQMMIADLTIGDINLEIEVKMTILVEETKEIGVLVKILVEVVENKWDV